MKLSRISFYGIGLLGIGVIGLVFKLFNPLEHAFFPKCPFKHVTGLDCPGCGGQRAIHYLLNGEFKAAFFQNPLLFLLVPYVVLGFYLQLVPTPTLFELKLRKILYGYYAIWILFAIILIYTVIRNIT